MKRLMLAAGGLLLATANTPPTSSAPKPEGELSSVVAAEAPVEAAKPAKPAKPAKAAKPHHMAAAPADPSPASYPRCSSSVRDRCVQGRSGYARTAPSRGMQLAMRAGERG